MQYPVYDLYSYYLNNPQYPTGQGIESLAPIATQSIINQNAGGDRDDDNTNVTTPTGTGTFSFSDVAKGLGFMVSPLGFLANQAIGNVTGTTPVSGLMSLINNSLARFGIGPGQDPNTITPSVTVGYGYTGGSGDTGSAPGAGDPNASMGDTGMATGGDGGGVGSSSDAGAGSTDSCGSFKDGGYVALEINPRNFK